MQYDASVKTDGEAEFPRRNGSPHRRDPVKLSSDKSPTKDPWKAEKSKSIGKSKRRNANIRNGNTCTVGVDVGAEMGVKFCYLPFYTAYPEGLAHY